ncbi:phenylethanolamine N-methyltransferase-like [Brachionichthys hirsutus]|uniref:phenylethanolamine N-methyltransferase-like n=1 Tax=Brachionichthys hirsutus TaxID=412623 RepID=UPI0036051E3D
MMEDKGTPSAAGAEASDYNEFDPAEYLQCFYSAEVTCLEEEDSFMCWILSRLHRAFSEGDVRGDLLVDVGSGPTLHQVLSGCELFNKVILTDFLEVNRKELKLWLHGGSKMDWTSYLKRVCELEGRSPSEWTQKAARLRQVVTDILPIDVHRPQPLAHDALPSAGADCLVSSFCLEAASPDLASFSRALGHIGGLLRPGGHLLLIGALEHSYYIGGAGVRIPVFAVNEAQVCDSLKQNGFTLIRLEVFQVSAETIPDKLSAVVDAKGICFVKARRN